METQEYLEYKQQIRILHYSAVDADDLGGDIAGVNRWPGKLPVPPGLPACHSVSEEYGPEWLLWLPEAIYLVISVTKNPGQSHWP